MPEPIPIRFAEPPRARTTLPLWAAATGDPELERRVRETFGLHAGLDRARGLFRVDPEGLLVGHDPVTADICFCSDDVAHTHHDSRPLIMFKRSMPLTPAPNEVPVPAWPRRETLDVTSAPRPFRGVPIVTFCGVDYRPPARVAFIKRFREMDGDGLRVNILGRDRFDYPDACGYLDSILEAHAVLCPAGMGRFSYRLYETLAAGRIPIVPRGNHTYAPAHLRERAWIIQAETPEAFLKFWRRSMTPERLAWVSDRNRRAWRDLCSPGGWLVTMAAAVRARRTERGTADGRR